MKAFFVDALSSALDLGIATPDDVLRHATPDLLAQHLPRPLWARLLTACLGASRVDAQLVVETVGVSNLCEHIPSTVIWACLADVGHRALGGEIGARPPASAPPAVVTAPAPVQPAAPLSISGPPEPEPVKPAPAAPPPMAGPSIPAPGPSALADLAQELADEDRASAPARPRTATGNRFRSTSTNIGRLAQNNRRPQAAAPTPPAPQAVDPVTERPRAPIRRGETEMEVEIEPDPTSNDWRSALAVEDEQLVDWAANEETSTSAGEDPSFRNKR